MEGAIDALESELGQRCEELRAREAEVDRLSFEAQELRSGISQSHRESDALRRDLLRTRELAAEQAEGLAAVGRQLDELRTTARGQATRMRLRALREAALLSAAATEAAANPEIRGERHERLLAALEEAIERVSSDWEPEELDAESARTAAAAAAASEAVSSVRAGARAERRRVSVDVGPFADFSQLVRFEDAANAIGATGDISIKRFSEGRARIDVALSEPVDLLRELEERCDLDFKVRSAADDEIVLDVGAEE